MPKTLDQLRLDALTLIWHTIHDELVHEDELVELLRVNRQLLDRWHIKHVLDTLDAAYKSDENNNTRREATPFDELPPDQQEHLRDKFRDDLLGDNDENEDKDDA